MVGVNQVHLRQNNCTCQAYGEVLYVGDWIMVIHSDVVQAVKVVAKLLQPICLGNHMKGQSPWAVGLFDYTQMIYGGNSQFYRVEVHMQKLVVPQWE